MKVFRKLFWNHQSSGQHKRPSIIQCNWLMNMMIIMIIITLMMITTSINAFLPMDVHQHESIPESSISKRFFGISSVCSCRARCNAVPKCVAAMVYTHTSGVLDCYLSEGKAFANYELLPNASAITLLKRVTECLTPFVFVPRGGCIKALTPADNYAQARKACQDLDADIFSPNDDSQVFPVYKYLNSSWPSSGISWMFWAGIKDRKWLDGRIVLDWYAGQPDGTLQTQPCGYITHLGKLADASCDKVCLAVCERKIYLQ